MNDQCNLTTNKFVGLGKRISNRSSEYLLMKRSSFYMTNCNQILVRINKQDRRKNINFHKRLL